MESPKRVRKGIATHFAYLGGGSHRRRVTKLFNLTGVTVARRRLLIHELIGIDGECLAVIPDAFSVDCDLDDLEKFLEGEL